MASLALAADMMYKWFLGNLQDLCCPFNPKQYYFPCWKFDVRVQLPFPVIPMIAPRKNYLYKNVTDDSFTYGRLTRTGAAGRTRAGIPPIARPKDRVVRLTCDQTDEAANEWLAHWVTDADSARLWGQAKKKKKTIPDDNDCSACHFSPRGPPAHGTWQRARLRSFIVRIYSAFTAPLPPPLYSHRALDSGFYKVSA